jgi:hypothetical protein
MVRENRRVALLLVVTTMDMTGTSPTRHGERSGALFARQAAPCCNRSGLKTD